jgi:hypothetical protein
VRILNFLVLSVCGYASGFFELCSKFFVVACVWHPMYGGDLCSCICGVLVCVIMSDISVVMSCVGSTQETFVYLTFYESSVWVVWCS